MTQIDRDRNFRYDQPAAEWVTGLPVGNGRLGAMVLGQPDEERFAINEETLWAGGHTERTPADASTSLEEIRSHVFDGDYETAQELCNDRLLGDPPVIRPYQPFCDLEIDLAVEGVIENYQRKLDLENGVVCVEYTASSTTYTREYFVSAPDGVLVVRLSADEPGAIDASISLT